MKRGGLIFRDWVNIHSHKIRTLDKDATRQEERDKTYSLELARLEKSSHSAVAAEAHRASKAHLEEMAFRASPRVKAKYNREKEKHIAAFNAAVEERKKGLKGKVRWALAGKITRARVKNIQALRNKNK